MIVMSSSLAPWIVDRTELIRQAVRVASGSETRAEERHVPLAATIRALRRELMEAVGDGKDEELRFALGPLDLELQVEVSSSGGGEAGIKFWVLSLGGKGERSSGATQTLRLRLTPVLSSAEGDVLVGHEQSARPD
jgi:Trypsin-co-occurring domain 2